MILQQPRYSPEAAARKGDALYETVIRPLVEADNQGKYVAIVIESGAWEMDADEDTASERLRQRIPDAQIYVTRIGYGYIRQFGARSSCIGGLHRGMTKMSDDFAAPLPDDFWTVNE